MAPSRNQLGNESPEVNTSFQPNRPHEATALSPYPAGSNDAQSATDSLLATGPAMIHVPDLEPLTPREELEMMQLLSQQEQPCRTNNQIVPPDQQLPNHWIQTVSYGASNLAQPDVPLQLPPSRSGFITAPVPAIVGGAPTANSAGRRGRGRGRGNGLLQGSAATGGRLRPILPAPTTDGLPIVFPASRNRAEESLSQVILQRQNLERHRTTMNQRFASMRTSVPPNSSPATATMTQNDRARILINMREIMNIIFRWRQYVLRSSTRRTHE